MNRLHFLTIVSAIVFSFVVSENTSASDPVQVKIRSAKVGVSKRVITIADIAEVTGGDHRLRKQVSELDLDLIAKHQSSVSISMMQIQVRLILSGIAASDFEILGAEEINVRLTRPKDFQQQVEKIVRRELVDQFGLLEEDVQVHLLDRAKLTTIQKSIDTSSMTALVIFPAKLPIGEHTVRIEFSDVSGNRASAKLPVRILVVKELLIAKSRIPRGTVITADFIQQIKRPLPDNSVEPADALQCIGYVAAVDIPQHEILATNFLTRKTESTRKLLKRNDFVDVVIEQGSVSIRLKNAKVLSPGSPGDIVQILNTSTNKRFTATVRDKHTVVVAN